MPAAAAVLIAATATGGVVAMSSADQATPSAGDTPASTAAVEQGDLSAMVSQDGTLTYRARPDGSPYPVINRARGTFTALPESGHKVGCGGVLYRVDGDVAAVGRVGVALQGGLLGKSGSGAEDGQCGGSAGKRLAA